MAIEQWGFISVLHLLLHVASVYNGHLRGPVTLTPIPERLAVELSVPIFTTWVWRGWDSNTQPSACEANALAPRLPDLFQCWYHGKMTDNVDEILALKWTKVYIRVRDKELRTTIYKGHDLIVILLFSQIEQEIIVKETL